MPAWLMLSVSSQSLSFISFATSQDFSGPLRMLAFLPWMIIFKNVKNKSGPKKNDRVDKDLKHLKSKSRKEQKIIIKWNKKSK